MLQNTKANNSTGFTLYKKLMALNVETELNLTYADKSTLNIKRISDDEFLISTGKYEMDTVLTASKELIVNKTNNVKNDKISRKIYESYLLFILSHLKKR